MLEMYLSLAYMHHIVYLLQPGKKKKKKKKKKKSYIFCHTSVPSVKKEEAHIQTESTEWQFHILCLNIAVQPNIVRL